MLEPLEEFQLKASGNGRPFNEIKPRLDRSRQLSGLRLRALLPFALAMSFVTQNAEAIDVASQADWNAAVAAVAAAGSNATVQINITSGFALTSSLSALVSNSPNVVVNIVGNNSTINGNSLYQGIQVAGTNGPTVNISSLTLTNTLAKGGNGGSGGDGGGGGGLGAGGGLFVASGARVTLQDVAFTNNTAKGGDGGVSGAHSGGSGGGALNGGTGGTAPSGSGTGGAGGVGASSTLFPGGGGAAGTGGGINTSNGGTGGTASTGGGGGGGGAATNTFSGGAGGAGGFGGGGGGGGIGGTVASAGGAAGYGGGAGGDGNNGPGTGGTGYGGAVFVMDGASLTIKTSGDFSYSGNTTAQGSRGSPAATRGQDIYINGASQVITFEVNSGTAAFVGSTQTTQGSIAGEGGVTKTGAGTLVLSGTQRYTGATTISAGEMILNGSLTSSVAVNNGAVIGTLAGSTGTITGNYTQAAGAVFRTQVADNSTYGKLVVTGTATLPSNARIDVDVTNPNFSFSAARMANVISAGTLVSDGSFAVTDNSNLFNFRAAKNGNAVDLIVAPAISSTVLHDVDVTGNRPARGLAAVLDNLISTYASNGTSGNTDMDSVINAFGRLTTERDVSSAASQTLPLLTGGSIAAVQTTMNDVNGIVLSRLDHISGRASGDSFLGDKYVWLKPFASRADQSERDGVAGYKAETSGLVAGVDGTLSPALRVGGAFAYAGSDVNSKSAVAPQSNDISLYQLIGYASYALNDGSEINFQVDVGQNTNKGRRQIDLNSSVASSSYDSQTAHLGLGFGRAYPLAGGTTLTPFVRADYTWIKDNSYSETGAGALNLNVPSRTAEALVFSLRSKLAHELNDQTTLIANLGIGYDTINDRNTITTAFAGASSAAFVTYGIDPSPWTGWAGVGAVYKLKNGFEITGRYDVEFRESFLNQTASATLRWAF